MKLENDHAPVVEVESEVEVEDSAGILDANANSVEKYNAQITLSAANPAAKTEGETARALDIAT